MRLRVLAAAAALAILPSVTADAAPASPRLTISGPLGTVQITEARLRQLMDDARGVPYEQGDAFLSRLSLSEQIALNYGVNADQITSLTSTGGALRMGPCGATIEECDPPAPRAPGVEVEKPVPDPAPAPECAGANVTLEARTVVFNLPVWEFHQSVYRCWDGVLVTNVSQWAGYSVSWPVFWTCVSSEVPPMPIYTQLPPTDAPSVTAIATGLCIYEPRIKVSVLGRDFEVATGKKTEHPTIHTTLRADGGRVSTKL